MTNPLVIQIMGNVANGSNALVGYLGAGLVFNQVGPPAPARLNSRAAYNPVTNLVIRFRGQLFLFGRNATNSNILVYDEGGTNTWTTSPESGTTPPAPTVVTAKGGAGFTLAGAWPGPLNVIQTENGEYLVCTNSNTSGNAGFHRYRPDEGTNGQWSSLFAPSAAGAENGQEAFVWNGRLWSTNYNNAYARVVSYDPDTNVAIEYNSPAFNINNTTTAAESKFFSLHGRLFAAQAFGANTAVEFGTVFIHAIRTIDNTLTAPPGSPAVGDSYVVAATATGAWTGLEDRLVVWNGSAWIDVKNGTLQINDKFLITGGAGTAHNDTGGPAGGAFVTRENNIATVTGTGPLTYSFATPVNAQDIAVIEHLAAGGNAGPNDLYGYTYASTGTSWNENTTYKYSQFQQNIWEYESGAFVERVLATKLKFGAPQNSSNGICVFPISSTKVLVIGSGPSKTAGGVVRSGLTAFVITTAGNSPSGSLVATEVTYPVIPPALIASYYTPPGAGGPGSKVISGDPQVRGYTSTAADGSKKHYLYYAPDGIATVTTAALYEVIDDATEMILNPGTPDSDSDYAYPGDFWGGGHREGGVDEANRFVSVGPRGYQKGSVGLIVKCRGYGDPTVLAYHNKVGTFTVGETITGGTSGATAQLMGDGTAEGLYVRNVVGTFVADEQVTGGTSGATADLNTVLLHGAVTAGPFQVGETVTGGTSGATGTVTHLGLGGTGEELVKVEWTSSPTQFSNGEVITGGTSGASATLSAAPRGYHGGAADKTIRARYYWSGGAGGQGKGVPVTGYCTMRAGSGVGGTVSKGTGPGGSDQLINVVADGGFGSGDTPSSFEWDFLADGLPNYAYANVVLEIDRV